MPTSAFSLPTPCPPPVVVAGGQVLTGPEHSEHRMEFEELLARNLPRFRRVAMRWLRNHEDAEDAVQDAMLSAFKHLARFEGRAQMSSWLTAIVINAVRMQLRRRPGHKMVSLDDAPQEDQFAISELIADPGPTPEHTVEKSEQYEIVARITGKLPVAQRTALQLHQMGLSIKEAADALGVPEGTLKSQIARARAALTQRVRKAVGASETQMSSAGSKARRKGPCRPICGSDFAESVVPLPMPGFAEQMGCTSVLA